MSSRRFLALVLLALMLGCLLRVWGIAHESLWFDEVFSQRIATQTSPGSLLIEGVAGDVHPPLYFFLLTLWVRLAGDSELALRLPSAFCMMLALPGMYHLARLLFTRRVALIALGLGAICGFQTYYGHEARQYALSLLCGVWSLVGLSGLVRGRRYGLPLYVVATLAGLYTHYYNALLITIAHFWLIGGSEPRAKWRVWLVADLIIGVLFLPQAFIAFGQLGAVLTAFWITPPVLAQPIMTTSYLIFGDTLPSGFTVVEVILPMLALALGTWNAIYNGSVRIGRNMALCWLLYFGVLVPILLYSLIRPPIYLDRSFAFLSPLLVVMLAGGVSVARRRSVAPTLLLLLVLLMLFGSIVYPIVPGKPKRPYREIAAFLNNNPAPVLHIHDESSLPMAYYAPNLTQRLGDFQARSWLYPRTWEVFGIERESRSALEKWLQGYHGYLWIIAGAVEPPAKDFMFDLAKRACNAEQQFFNVDKERPVTVIRLRFC